MRRSLPSLSLVNTNTTFSCGITTTLMCQSQTNSKEDESLVDDLNMERGIVSGRVALLLRSAEIKPLFCDLFYMNKIYIVTFQVMGRLLIKMVLGYQEWLCLDFRLLEDPERGILFSLTITVMQGGRIIKLILDGTRIGQMCR